MNKHLQQVRAFHDQYAIKQPTDGDASGLSEVDILMRQALLLDCASATITAMAADNALKTLAGLVDLAFNALAAIASRGDEVIAVSANWRQDGSVLSVLKVLSDKVNQCTSGETVHYSGLYAMCVNLSQRFVNADFDEAFQIVYQHLMSGRGDTERLDLSPSLLE